MLIENEFHVDLPFAEAWKVMSELERIAPCMPGAELTGVEDGTYQGVVKVKVGSITTQYRGSAHVADADESAGRIVVDAQGHETRGQGRAKATVTAVLVPDGDGTAVAVSTDLQISGRVAQFGRGVLQDVSTKLLEQFIERLQAEFGSSDARGATDMAATVLPAASHDRDREPVDLLALGRGPVLRRAAPVAIALALVVLLVILRRRRRS